MTGAISDEEIRAGCTAIDETLRVRDELEPVRDAVADADRLYLAGCGSSYWAAVIAGYRFREADVDATAVHASDFLFADYLVGESTAVVGYSQSGETEETVRALDAAATAGATTVAMTNTAGSRLDERASRSFVTPAGEQEALFATKTVDAAVAASYPLAGLVDGRDGDLAAAGRRCRAALDIDLSPAVETLRDAECAYALGTGIEYGLAGETATKLGEAAVLHATPQPALEVAHGHVVNVDGDPVVLLATRTDAGGAHANVLSLLRDAGAETVVIHGPEAEYPADVAVELPASSRTVLPGLTVVQRLAREVALARGHDPDFPPGLSDYASRDLL